MKLILIVLTLLVIGSQIGVVHADSPLLGSWGMNGEILYRFNSDGTGDMDGASFQWQANGGILTFRAEGLMEEVSYQLQGDQLILVIGGVPLPLQRLGNVGVETQTNAGKPPTATVKKNLSTVEPGSNSLGKLLLSSAWCSFSYNQVSGATNQRRVQFQSDGSWSDNSRYEGYSSGDGGTMASQQDGGGGGRWQVSGDQLHMSGADANLQPVQLQVKTNSSGFPIIVADGIEFSQCQ